MSSISIKYPGSAGNTVLSNLFVDRYMPGANGEFVKVYIALLRLLPGHGASFDLEKLEDALLCTEKDVLRALRYWEKEGLLKLSFGPDRTLTDLELLEISADGMSTAEETSVPPQKAPAEEASGKAPSRLLTGERVKELQQDEALAQLLYIAEQYLARPLTSTEMKKILSFYEILHMSPELIEYLIEYCVSHNHKSIRYMETVALSWSKEGITTVAAAKEASSRYSKEYYSILKAMGITNRSPVEDEISFMDVWMKGYGFDLSVIQEACSRTVLKTGSASFPYADSILADWNRRNLRTLPEIRQMDERRRASSRRSPRQTAGKENRFNNFHQRDYDFDQMERELLGASVGVSSSSGAEQE